MKWFFVFLIFVATNASAQINFHIQTSAIADFLYQLDCVSGVEPRCSVQNYTDLWKKNFLKTNAQREGLTRWQSLRQKINESVRTEAESTFDLNSKFQIASIQSSGLEDYLKRLDLLITPKNKEACSRDSEHILAFV